MFEGLMTSHSNSNPPLVACFGPQGSHTTVVSSDPYAHATFGPQSHGILAEKEKKEGNRAFVQAQE